MTGPVNKRQQGGARGAPRPAATPAGMPMLAASAAGRLTQAIRDRIGGPHGRQAGRPLAAAALWRQVARRMGYAPPAATRSLLPAPQASYWGRPDLIWR